MARRKLTAAEYIEKNATIVPAILGDMIEHLGLAVQEWSGAIEAMRRDDYETALEHVVNAGIEADIPLKVGRSEIREITNRAGNLLDELLPDDDEPPSRDIRPR